LGVKPFFDEMNDIRHHRDGGRNLQELLPISVLAVALCDRKLSQAGSNGQTMPECAVVGIRRRLQDVGCGAGGDSDALTNQKLPEIWLAVVVPAHCKIRPSAHNNAQREVFLKVRHSQILPMLKDSLMGTPLMRLAEESSGW